MGSNYPFMWDINAPLRFFFGGGYFAYLQYVTTYHNIQTINLHYYEESISFTDACICCIIMRAS